MALEEAQDLHLLRKLGQEFLVPFEMMNLGGIPASERAHGLDALPIGDRHEFGFVPAILAERLDTERLVEERLDAGFVVVGFILVGAVAGGSPAPDADNGGLLESRDVHDKVLLCRTNSGGASLGMSTNGNSLRISKPPPFALRRMNGAFFNNLFTF